MASLTRFLPPLALAGAAFFTPAAAPARAETIVNTGLLGSYTAGLWPFLVAQQKGMFARRGIKHDIAFVPTAPGLVQQLAAGSLDMAALNGLVEPLHAVEKGAPVAITRIVGQSSNYAMIGQPGIRDLADLKGTRIALGGLRDINRIYFDRVMRGTGLKEADYDLTVIGATGARFAALQAKGIDATMLVPPFNFMAQKLGFKNLGLVRDAAPDLPQTGMQASLRWARAHLGEARQVNAAIDEAVAWFNTPANRDEAVSMMAAATKTDRGEVAESYDFMRAIEYFAPTSAIRRAPLESMMRDMVALKDMAGVIPVDALVVPGLNEIVD